MRRTFRRRFRRVVAISGKPSDLHGPTWTGAFCGGPHAAKVNCRKSEPPGVFPPHGYMGTRVTRGARSARQAPDRHREACSAFWPRRRRQAKFGASSRCSRPTPHRRSRTSPFVTLQRERYSTRSSVAQSGGEAVRQGVPHPRHRQVGHQRPDARRLFPETVTGEAYPASSLTRKQARFESGH